MQRTFGDAAIVAIAMSGSLAKDSDSGKFWNDYRSEVVILGVDRDGRSDGFGEAEGIAIEMF